MGVQTTVCNSDGGHLLFEIEHSVDFRIMARQKPSPRVVSGARPDLYKACAEAAVVCIYDLLHFVHFTRFSFLVNRRLLRPKDWEGTSAKFPNQENALLESTGNGAADGNQNRFQPSPPCCPRARRHVAARYPRPASFEVTVYDAERASHLVVFSKYQVHRLPKKPIEIWSALLPFIVTFAAHCGEEGLINRVAEFANLQGIPVGLSVAQLTPCRGRAVLIDSLLDGLEDLREALESGDPEQLKFALDTMPNGIRTADVLRAEDRMAQLRAAENRIHQAFSLMQKGLFTSGVDQLRVAIQSATAIGLQGHVLEQGFASLESALQDLGSDADLGKHSEGRGETIISDETPARSPSPSQRGPSLLKVARSSGSLEPTRTAANVWNRKATSLRKRLTTIAILGGSRSCLSRNQSRMMTRDSTEADKPVDANIEECQQYLLQIVRCMPAHELREVVEGVCSNMESSTSTESLRECLSEVLTHMQVSAARQGAAA